LHIADVTELTEPMLSESTLRRTTNSNHSDHWLIAPLISYWLIMSKQCVRSCFI